MFNCRIDLKKTSIFGVYIRCGNRYMSNVLKFIKIGKRLKKCYEI